MEKTFLDLEGEGSVLVCISFSHLIIDRNWFWIASA